MLQKKSEVLHFTLSYHFVYKYFNFIRSCLQCQNNLIMTWSVLAFKKSTIPFNETLEVSEILILISH